jgi:hypothetical protein
MTLMTRQPGSGDRKAGNIGAKNDGGHRNGEIFILAVGVRKNGAGNQRRNHGHLDIHPIHLGRGTTVSSCQPIHQHVPSTGRNRSSKAASAGSPPF